MEQVLVFEVDLVAPPAEVVAEITRQTTLCGEIGGQRSYGHVVSIHRGERTIGIGLARIEEAIVVEIIAPGRIARIVQPAQQRERFGNLMDVVGGAAGNRAEFALAYQSLSEVRIQRQNVGAKEARKLQLLAATELPHVVQREERGMRLVLLPGVDGVRELGDIGIEGIPAKDRNQSRNVGLAVISDAHE